MTSVKVVVSIGCFLAQDLLYTGLAWIFHVFGLCRHQRAQLLTSVILVPVVGDAFQFAVQDSFLKKKQQPTEHVEIESDDGEDESESELNLNRSCCGCQCVAR